MQAYDVKRKCVVKVEREENGVIYAYSLPGEPGSWYFPLVEDGKNVEPYKILEGGGWREVKHRSGAKI